MSVVWRACLCRCGIRPGVLSFAYPSFHSFHWFALITRSSCRAFQTVFGFSLFWTAEQQQCHIYRFQSPGSNRMEARGYTSQLTVQLLRAVPELLSGLSPSWGELSMSVYLFVLKPFYWCFNLGQVMRHVPFSKDFGMRISSSTVNISQKTF